MGDSFVEILGVVLAECEPDPHRAAGIHLAPAIHVDEAELSGRRVVEREHDG